MEDSSFQLDINYETCPSMQVAMVQWSRRHVVVNYSVEIDVQFLLATFTFFTCSEYVITRY
jgi:hypothetical protein